MLPIEEQWAIFMYGGQIGTGKPSESAAILFFMKTYDISKDEWELGVKNKKYECRKIVG